uniref:beta-galactosidase trimerization domain-containing protein n=1 Tax=Demequina sp. NBRC 110054 TaxID=1570343 RepID=UPI00190E6734
LLVDAFAAAVDEHDAVHAGGFMAPLKGALGVTCDEYLPLRPGDAAAVVLDDGTELPFSAWAEDLALAGAEVIGTYAGGPADGAPAITRHSTGEGHAWYVSAQLTTDALAAVYARVYADAWVEPQRLPEGVEVVTRRGDEEDFVVVLNHGDQEVRLPIAGTDVLTGGMPVGEVTVASGGAAVVRVPLTGQGGEA